MIRLSEQNSRVIKFVLAITFIMIINLIASPVHAAGNSSTSNRLILFQGFILNAYYNDQYVEVKRLDPYRSGSKFYGYGWFDDNSVFVAYQGNTAEAVAEIEIIDLRLMRTRKLKGIGGIGESLFDVNPATGDVIYSTGDEINLMKIDATNNTYRIEPVKQKTNCWAAFWIDSKTIGCKLIVKNKDVFVKYKVP